jgi:hypothetical protein
MIIIDVPLPEFEDEDGGLLFPMISYLICYAKVNALSYLRVGHDFV